MVAWCWSQQVPADLDQSDKVACLFWMLDTLGKLGTYAGMQCPSGACMQPVLASLIAQHCSHAVQGHA
eukprot:204256-Amphidinium_carterae.1